MNVGLCISMEAIQSHIISHTACVIIIHTFTRHKQTMAEEVCKTKVGRGRELNQRH